MTYSGIGVDHSDRVAFWLRSAGTSAKEAARIVGASEETGKRLRNGGRATSDQLAALARHFGWRFVQFVYEPLCGPAAVAADEEAIHELKERLARIEAAVCGPDGAPASAPRDLARRAG